MLPDAFACPRQARHDGSNGNIQYLGHFFIGKIFHRYQEQDAPQPFRQALDGPHDVLRRNVFFLTGQYHERSFRDHVQRVGGTSYLALTDPVDIEITKYREKPRPHLGILLPRMQAIERPDKTIMHEIVDLLAIS